LSKLDLVHQKLLDIDDRVRKVEQSMDKLTESFEEPLTAGIQASCTLSELGAVLAKPLVSGISE